jgi:hypothetical protein
MGFTDTSRNAVLAEQSHNDVSAETTINLYTTGREHELGV